MSPTNPHARKRRPSAGRNKLEAPVEKSLAQHGIDFLALVLGLVAASLILLLVWSFLTGRVAEDTQERPASSSIEQSLTATSDEEFERVLGRDNLPQLENLLEILNRRAADETTSTDVKTHRRRLKVVKKMLLADLNADLRYDVLSTRIDALERLSFLNRELDLDDSSFEFELRSTAKKLATDRDHRIAVKARLASVILDADDPAIKTGAVAKDLYRLAKDYPNHPEVLNRLRIIVADSISKPNQRESGIRLASEVLAQVKEGEFVDHAALSNVLQEYQDWVYLMEEDYFDAWESRTFRGSAGFDKLVEVGVQLCQKRTGGARLLATVQGIAFWFEQGNEYGHARSLYQSMSEASEQFDLPSIGKMAQLMGDNGVVRCNLVGSRFRIEGVTLDGTPIDASEFENRVVIVVYFSLASSKSVNVLNFLNRERSAWEGKSVREIAVCIDQSSDDSFDPQRLDNLAKALPDWVICIRDEQGKLPMFDQCPSQQISRVLMVDRQGNVSDVNIKPNELRAQVGFALMSGRP